MPKGVYKRKPTNLKARFESKVDTTLPPWVCWPWQAHSLPKGYGMIGKGSAGAGSILAHRASYEIYVGPIPEGVDVRHTCDHPWCVNPNHLVLGTRSNNMDDMHSRKRSRWHLYKNGTLDGHKPQTEKGQWKRRRRNRRGQFD